MFLAFVSANKNLDFLSIVVMLSITRFFLDRLIQLSILKAVHLSKL